MTDADKDKCVELVRALHKLLSANPSQRGTSACSEYLDLHYRARAILQPKTPAEAVIEAAVDWYKWFLGDNNDHLVDSPDRLRLAVERYQASLVKP